MGLALPHLERLAVGAGHRQARNGRGLGSPRISSAVLKLIPIALLLPIAPRCGPRAPPNYEFRFHDNFFGIGLLYRSINALQNSLGSKDTHLAERLFNCCKAGVLKRSALNVVEADDG